VFKFSKKKYKFECNQCGHTYEADLTNVTHHETGCPYCNNRKLCSDDTCKFCFNASFASNKRSINWSKQNTKSPRNVFKSSREKYKFDCDKCGHIFEIKIAAVHSGNWCIYCASQKLCDDENCDYCFRKSFASSERFKNWSKQNDENARNVFKSSGKKYKFDCDKCHNVFEAALNGISKGNGCPICIHKTETIVYEKLKSEYDFVIIQFQQQWCKSVNLLPFDFCIEDSLIIIELDGKQHFEQVWNWKSPEEQFERDMYKQKCANDNGYSIIRLLQEDVHRDKYDWFNELIQNINKIINEKKVQNIYMCKNNEYKLFVSSNHDGDDNQNTD
jgi:very-short-patch-repair endonuclease